MFKIDRRRLIGVTLMAVATLLPLHPASAELKGEHQKPWGSSGCGSE